MRRSFRDCLRCAFAHIGQLHVFGELKLKGENMNDQNRVLSRTNARELTQPEIDAVSGGFITFSVCTSSPSPDGDQHPFETGC
jgi:hypothetical protein